MQSGLSYHFFPLDSIHPSPLVTPGLLPVSHEPAVRGPCSPAVWREDRRLTAAGGTGTSAGHSLRRVYAVHSEWLK